MLPDFIQDLDNVGVESRDLDPLFRGAENLARTWELSLRRSEIMKP